MPLVSILFPVFKTAQYLKEAIDSILSQTYTDFELIILNDCSPDNSEEIINSYQDPMIVKYVGEINLGLANVLNLGMDMARGTYIARMDSDDISLPERIAIQVNFLEKNKDVDLCSCGMELFGAKTGIWTRESDYEKVKITALHHSPILHASSMWRKESFVRLDLKYNQNMVPAEDYDLWCRALAAGLKLVNIPDVLYKYRIHPSQITRNTLAIKNKEKEVQQQYLKLIFPNNNIRGPISLFYANFRKPFFRNSILFKRKIKRIHVIDKFILRNSTEINFYNTLLLRNHQRTKLGCRCLCMKHGHVALSPKSVIEISNGRFILNAKWVKNEPETSLLFMGENSRLIVEGYFDIYSGSKIYINNNAELKLGSGYINHHLNLSCFNSISIGNKVYISEGVSIRDDDNHYINKGRKLSTKSIVIKDNVWIGLNVTILKGVTIGKGCVIGAGSVVISDIPDNCLAVGVPAKVIKRDIIWQ